jgi:outer membrane protein OmpA-like peptidoglycan-associated protein
VVFCTATVRVEDTAALVDHLGRAYGAFELDDATLRPESEPTLMALQRLLKAQEGLRIEVVVHTDARDAGGDAEAGRALSARRAEAVKLWFARHRIDDARITPRGLGASAPLRPSESAEDRARNRRVEIRKVDCGS